jgi:hypothetical protein
MKKRILEKIRTSSQARWLRSGEEMGFKLLI